MFLRNMEEARKTAPLRLSVGGISEGMSNDDLPNVHSPDPEKKPRDAELTGDHVQCALVKIIDALRPLNREARIRVLNTARTFYGDPNGASVRRSLVRFEVASESRTGKNMIMPSAEVLRRAHEEIDQAMRALRAQEGLRRRKPASRVEVGSKVIVGLRGGGRVEGILARRIGHGVVVEGEDAADVIVLESASYGTRVLPKD